MQTLLFFSFHKMVKTLGSTSGVLCYISCMEILLWTLFHFYCVANGFIAGGAMLHCLEESYETGTTVKTVILMALFGSFIIVGIKIWDAYRKSSLAAFEIVIELRLKKDYELFLEYEDAHLAVVEKLNKAINSGKLSYVSKLLHKWVINEYLRKIAIAKQKCGI